MRAFWFTATAVLLAAFGLGSRLAAQSPALRVFVANGVRDFVKDLGPELERAAGMPISLDIANAAALEQRIQAGEPFDVALLCD